MRMRAAPVLIAVGLLTLGRLPAEATVGSSLLVITSASVDDGVITIRGGNFGEAAPYVTLAGIPIQVLRSSPTEVLALLPEGTAPGTYLLGVARNPLRIPFYLTDLTIGAAGVLLAERRRRRRS